MEEGGNIRVFFSWGDDVLSRDDHSKKISPPISFSKMGGPAVGGAWRSPKPPLLTLGASPPGPPDLHGEGTEPYINIQTIFVVHV